jgi:cycloeucalenol cycloisomerase
MPAHDANAVPIAMFFATHFYFSLYHALASKALRWVHACFQPGNHVCSSLGLWFVMLSL